MLRLLDVIYSKEKVIQGEAAVVLLDLGVSTPVSLGLVYRETTFIYARYGIIVVHVSNYSYNYNNYIIL